MFQHGLQDQIHDQPGPSHSPPTAATCPVCYTQLPASEQQAAAHISSCIASNQVLYLSLVSIVCNIKCHPTMATIQSAIPAHTIHVHTMLVRLQSDSSDSEVYEEYTWGDITRVRATSMLDARTRASEFSFSGCSGVCQLPASPLPQHLYTDLFNGTVILNEAEEENYILDVEGDSSEVYGPSQYPTPTAIRYMYVLQVELLCS